MPNKATTFFLPMSVLSLLFKTAAQPFGKNKPKPLPEEDQKRDPHFAVLIPARDESKVIEGLFKDLCRQTQKVPAQDIYVIIESPDDPTAKLAAKYGMTVRLRKNMGPGRRCKGCALEEVVEDIWPKLYDAYFIFDADNRVDKDFFKDFIGEMRKTRKNALDKLTEMGNMFFEKLEEVTPLMLQKLLYFIQGVYSALYGRPIFFDVCRAWVHGPVYPEVYELFRDFKYNPIDDARFALLEGAADALTDEEKRVIDLVVNTFGMYGGKVLEKITHNEAPCMEARKGYGDSIPSNELLPKERIMEYYILINQKYGIDTEDGLRTYIHDMLEIAS